MLLLHRPTKLLVTGKSGSGKTTYFERFVSNGFRSCHHTIFLFDWQGEMSLRFGVQPVFKIADLPRALESGFVLFDPSEEFEGTTHDGLCFFAQWAFEVSKLATSQGLPQAQAPRLFCCDEMQLLLGTDELPNEVATVLETGRRWGLDCALVAQQLNQCHNRVRTQATELVTFQHEDPLVLDALAMRGFDPAQVAALPPLAYLWRNDRGEQGQGQLRF